jgi:hypothetical protein
MKKLKRKSPKFLKRIRDFESQLNTSTKKIKNDLKKTKKIENFDDESTQTSKEIILNVLFAKTFVERKISYKLINC